MSGRPRARTQLRQRANKRSWAAAGTGGRGERTADEGGLLHRPDQTRPDPRLGAVSYAK